MIDPAVNPIIAQWDVGGETYQDMIEEAESDAILFMRDFTNDPWKVEVLGCQPEKQEESRIVYWRGKAIIYLS